MIYVVFNGSFENGEVVYATDTKKRHDKFIQWLNKFGEEVFVETRISKNIEQLPNELRKLLKKDFSNEFKTVKL